MSHAYKLQKQQKEEQMLLIKPLINEHLVLVPPAQSKFTVVDHHYDARQKKRVSEDQQILADRVLGYSIGLVVGLTHQIPKKIVFFCNS